MIEWASQYWYLCVIALLIGIATAAWIWLSTDPGVQLPELDIDEVPAGPIQPNRPEIERAEPVVFAPPPARVQTTVTPPDGDRPAIAAAAGAPDDLTLIKGIGPKLSSLLGTLGVTRFDQIASWGPSDIAEVDRFLGQFQGRIARDSWVEQAGFLAHGDVAGFTARFGALDGGTTPG
jgi:predicted flap endonuclease-1-like 5' DNA nuclease